MLINKELFNQLLELAVEGIEYQNERWITVKPHGDDSKGVHVKVEDGETSKQAIDRKFGDSKGEGKEEIKSSFTSVTEAEKHAESNGVKYADYSKFSVEVANNINDAISTLPKDMRPDYITDFDTLYKKNWLRKTKQSNNSFGVSLSYPEMIKDKKDEYRNIDSTIAFNPKFRDFKKIEKKKTDFNKNVTHWFFNIKGEATAFHEIGHVYANSQGIDDEFADLAKKWYSETNIGMLKPMPKEFGGKNSEYSESFAEAYAGYYTKNPELPKYMNDYFDKLSKREIKLMSKEQKEELSKRITKMGVY